MSKLTLQLSSAYTLALGLGLSALGAGAVHLEFLAPFALLVIASASCVLLQKERDDTQHYFDRRAFVCIAVWGALALICLLQWVRLPLPWLQKIAADNADIWARALRPFGLPEPKLASISLAPGRSVLEALKVACYGMIFAVSARLSRDWGTRRLLMIAFAVPLLVAVVTAAHQLVGARRLFGIYEPVDAYTIAPLLNANSLGGYLNLGLFCGLGLAFRAGARPTAALFGVGIAFIAAEVLLCESRGASGALAIGLFLVLALPRGVRNPKRAPELSPLLQATVVVSIGVAGGLLAWAARHSPLGLDDRSLSKVELFSRSWQLAKDHFLLGVGRGAFASISSTYQTGGPYIISEHAENLPLQWSAEWGVPVAIGALAALLWSLRPIVCRSTWSVPTRRCALIGCAVVLIQNVVDLGLELPAYAGLLVFVLGALSGSTPSSLPTPRWLSARRVLAFGTALTALCLGLSLRYGVVAPSRLRHELHDELVAAHGAPTQEFWDALGRAVLAYPAEPYFPLLGSSASLMVGRDPLPWITRALERAPQSAQVHLELAKVLKSGGAIQQSLGALQRCVELDPRQTPGVLNLASGWGVSPEALTAVAPNGQAGAAVLAQLALRATDRALRVQLLEQSLARHSEQPDVHYQLATELLDDLGRGEGGTVCGSQRDVCLTQVAEHLQHGAVPDSPRSLIAAARLLAEQGNPLDAENKLASGCARFPGDLKCATALFDLALDNGSPRLLDATREFVAASCVNLERCGAAHRRLGDKFASSGRWNMALTHYQRAARDAPSAGAWRAVALAAEHVGEPELAADARRRVTILDSTERMAPAKPVWSGSSVPAMPDMDDMGAQRSSSRLGPARVEEATQREPSNER